VPMLLLLRLFFRVCTRTLIVFGTMVALLSCCCAHMLMATIDHAYEDTANIFKHLDFSIFDLRNGFMLYYLC